MSERWLGVHVFYSSNADPMLVECIHPLVERLREDGKIQRFFFIKYWIEGPHIRLRLLPAEGVTHEELKAAVEPAISQYLARRPALYDQPDDLGDFYKTLYVAEYGEEAWQRDYADGGMPLAPNNSFKYVDYEPEYDRYGGVEGLELAEWHFEKSSEAVLRLLRDANVHVRTILLGLSPQLSLPLCFGFLRDERKVVDFLTSYIDFWQTTFAENTPKQYPRFDAGFAKIREQLKSRVADIRDYVLGDASERPTAVERDWLAHVVELRTRVADLFAAGRLDFRSERSAAEAGTAAAEEGEADGGGGRGELNLEAALQILLSSYVHMTNNRLGVSILDEIYLSYQVRKALNELLEVQDADEAIAPLAERTLAS